MKNTMKNKPHINTFGELKESGYISLPIKDELRKNLIQRIQAKENVFEGILGYEKTVIPEIQRAILSTCLDYVVKPKRVLPDK